MTERKPCVALVLGGGAARGWAHIGVIEALTEHGIEPDMVVGTSVGAVVGGALASGQLPAFRDWITTLRRRDILRLLDARLSGGGLLSGAVLMGAIERVVGNTTIAELAMPFACVATELGSGREIWLREGELMAACRASISLPGLFAPVPYRGNFLVDGGLVNPVPVSLARAMGADIVIAVDLNGHLRGEHFWARNGNGHKSRGAPSHKVVEPSPRLVEADIAAAEPNSVVAAAGEESDGALHQGLTTRLMNGLSFELSSRLSSLWGSNHTALPGLLDVIVGSIDIMQDRITRSRMAGDPPDLHLMPRLSHIALMDFDRAAECIPEGRHAVERQAEEVERLAAMLAG